MEEWDDKYLNLKSSDGFKKYLHPKDRSVAYVGGKDDKYSDLEYFMQFEQDNSPQMLIHFNYPNGSYFIPNPELFKMKDPKCYSSDSSS